MAAILKSPVTGHTGPRSLRDPAPRRTFLTESIPTILIPPVVFTGLLLSLWTWKCVMTVVFQDKIIYMPYMPPFARSEKIADYANSCKPVVWEERKIKSVDGTRISLCVGSIPPAEEDASVSKQDGDAERQTVICYFQGNGSSTPPRLPLLSNVLRLLRAGSPDPRARHTLVALSYRGYWTSSGRATQSGIELDAEAMLSWVQANYVQGKRNTQLVLWGQSIGAGVASTAAVKHVSSSSQDSLTLGGIILETPFTSIKSMLLALYPQKWLPYQYLYPFLWNHWDSEVALRNLARAGKQPKMLLLSATRDEVVPPEEIQKLEGVCTELGMDYERKEVTGALHFEASIRREGQEAIANFIANVSESL